MISDQSLSLSDQLSLNGSSLLDAIHQLIINLYLNPSKDSIHNLLLECIEYFHKDLDNKTTNELIILIVSCLSSLQDQSEEKHRLIFNYSQKSSNHLILFAEVFSNRQNMSSFPMVQDFVQNIMIEIIGQIQIPKEKFLINNLEIKSDFLIDFIINITLLSKLDENMVSVIYNFVFSQKKVPPSKIKRLSQKVMTNNFLQIIPEIVFNNDTFVKEIPFNLLYAVIPRLSKSTFVKVLHLQSAILPYYLFWYDDRRVLTSILKKCDEYNYDIKSNSKLYSFILDNLINKNMEPFVWSYFEKNNIKLPEKVANELSEFPNPTASLKIMPNIEKIPLNTIIQILFDTNDLQIFELVLNYDFLKNDVDVFSQKKFWTHLFSVISSSEIKYSKTLQVKFSQVFDKYVDENNTYEILESMILDSFPSTNNGNSFLNDFINELKRKEKFIENAENLFKKIKDKEFSPLPSFWNIFSCDIVKKYYNNDDNKIAYLFALKFSKSSSMVSKVDEITIKPVINTKSQKFILKFIKDKNFESIMKMDDESAEFILSVLLYFDEDIKIELNGLTKETVLPFLAISLNCLPKEKYCYLRNISEKIANLLIKVCQFSSAEKSLFINELIDSIIIFNDYLFNSFLIPAKFTFQLFNFLINQLVKNCYDGNKLILLKEIFKLSHNYSTNEQIKNLFDLNGIKLYKFIIQNRSKIDNINSLLDIGLNPNVFKLSQTSSIIHDLIDNSTDYDDIVNTVWFINNVYKRCPKSIKTSKIFKFVEGSFKKENWDDLNIFNQFINHYELEKDQKNSIFGKFKTSISSQIVTRILADSHPEKNDFPLELLFKILMNDSFIVNDYFVILFEQVSFNQNIDPKKLLERYKHLYTNYNGQFMNAFCNIFEFNSQNFSRKVCYNCISNSRPFCGTSLISSLLNEAIKQSGNFQAFFCLQNIASSFPFLYTNAPHKVFTTVLPAFRSFLLLFDNKIEVIDSKFINTLKTTISALYFLFSTLYSVKVLDAFVPWFYTKIFTFSHSQRLALFYFVNSLFNTPIVNHVMLALSSKYDLPNIAVKLLKIDTDEKISSYYKYIILNILTRYYQLLNKLESTKKLIYIDEMKKMKNPFLHYFNNFSTIYPQKLQQLNFPIPEIPEIKEYVNDISKIRPFWLDFEKYEIINCEDIDHFKNRFNKLKATKIDKKKFTIKPLKIPIVNKIKHIRFCSNQSNWIYQYIIENNQFQLFPDHFIALKNTISKLDDLKNDKNEVEFNIDYNEVDINYFFKSDFNQKDLFVMLFNEALNNDKDPNEQIFWLIKAISKNKSAFQLFYDQFSTFISENQESIDFSNKLSNLINIFKIQNLFVFTKSNNNIINLIYLALSPKYRKDQNFLAWMSDLLCLFDNLPIVVNQLICFMIINGLNVDPIIKLCTKIGNTNANIIIQFLLDYILSKKSHDNNRCYSIFNELIQLNQSSININLSKALNTLENTITSYTNDKFKIQGKHLFIFLLFNAITPKRAGNIVNISIDDSCYSNNTKNYFNHPHPDLIKTNPEFWNFYEKYLNFFNNIFLDFTYYKNYLNIFTEYQELLDFDSRLPIFRKKMKNKINSNQTLHLNIDRSNILPNSFTFYKNKSRDEWLSNIEIKFNGENGIDLGGLTNNWFSLVVKELFNSNFALFELTEKNNYLPNHHSGINQEHIEFFRFAGKLIARSIIQGQYLDAHFTKSFYRQILHSQIQLNDLEDFDENIYKSFQMILNEDVEPLELNFTIDVDEYGVTKTILLKENGDRINVTNENKKEYVDLYVDYRLSKSIINQINAFREGFNFLIPANEISSFTPKELDLIICGRDRFDIDDFRNNIHFNFPYKSDHPVIVLFFKVISKWSSKELSKFLLFLTGSSQVPASGFREYKLMGKQISIAPGGDKNRLCVAHTCFNILDLPEYDNEEEMNSKLLLSIQECQFALG